MGDNDRALSLGGHLRALRLAKGDTLEEMARATRISARQLAALESEEFSELPAPIFVKGFIRAYCGFLGESPDRAIELYGPISGAPLAPPTEARTRRARTGWSWLGHPIAVSATLLLLFGVALLALNFGLRGHPKPAPPSATSAPPPRTAAPAPATPAPGTPAPAPPVVASAPSPRATAPAPPAGGTAKSAAPPQAPPAPTARSASSPPLPAGATAPTAPGAARPASPPTGPAADVRRDAPAPPGQPAPASKPRPGAQRLVVKAIEPTWIRVQMDGDRVAEELLPAGAKREWTADSRFVLTVGNAGGIQLELNGDALPPLGPSGAVVRQISIPAARGGS
jgi:cytoskeleton protein RodZ